MLASRRARPHRPRRPGNLGGLVLVLLGQGCAEEAPSPAPPAPAHPPGTALLVDGLPLLAEEVAPLCADIAALYPEYSPLHVRRLALTNEFLPRLAARAMEPERWRLAREACAEIGDALEGRETRTVEGTFRPLGVALWSAARRLVPGEWSRPIELTGRWLRVRLEERVEAADPREERLVLALIEFSFVGDDPQAAVESAIDRATLTLVDPAFAEAVPEAWKHRMHATRP